MSNFSFISAHEKKADPAQDMWASSNYLVCDNVDWFSWYSNDFTDGFAINLFFDGVIAHRNFF